MGGVQLGDGMVLGKLVVPNLWGAEVVHGLFTDEPVTASYLTSLQYTRIPMSARQLHIPDLYGMFLVRPTRTLAHPTPLSLATNVPKPKPALKQRHRSSSLSSVHSRPYMRSLRVYLFHPAVYAWLDAMVRSNAQLHGVVGKRFDAERVRLGRGDAGVGRGIR